MAVEIKPDEPKIIILSHSELKSHPRRPDYEPRTETVSVTALVNVAKYQELHAAFAENKTADVWIMKVKYSGKITASFESWLTDKATADKWGMLHPCRQVRFTLKVKLPEDK